MPTRLEQIETERLKEIDRLRQIERTQVIRELVPDTRLRKPIGSKKAINRCRVLNTTYLFRTSSKSSPHKRCQFSGRQQIKTASTTEPWVWACLKHVRYFLDTFGEIMIRDDPDSKSRVLRA